MSLILAYLKNDVLPEDINEVDRIRRIAPRYWISKERHLYRRSYTEPYLCFVHSDTVQDLLWRFMKEFVEDIQGDDLWHTVP